MSYGLVIKNEQGYVQVIDESPAYHFIAKINPESSRLVQPSSYSDPLAYTVFNYDVCRIFTYRFVFSVDINQLGGHILPFLKLNTPEGAAIFRESFDTYTYIIDVIQKGSSTVGPTVYLFTTFYVAYRIIDSINYGLIVRNATNNITYDSRCLPLRIHKTQQVTFPSIARSNINGYVDYEGEGASQVTMLFQCDMANNAYMDLSIDRSDVLFYGNSLAHASESYERTSRDSYSHDCGTRTDTVSRAWFGYAYYKGIYNFSFTNINTSYATGSCGYIARRAENTGSFGSSWADDWFGDDPSFPGITIDNSFFGEAINYNLNQIVMITKASYYDY